MPLKQELGYWIIAFLGLLLCAPMAARPSPHAPGDTRIPLPSRGAFRVSPEVFWISIVANGRRIGFGRGEYKRGETAAYQYQNTIVFDRGGMRQASRDWWDFGSDLRPATFFSKFIAWKAGANLTNTVDGVFNYKNGKLSCQYDEFNTHEKVVVPIPSQTISKFTQNIVLAREKLSAGKKYTFRVYGPQQRRFVLQEYIVLDWDTSEHAWKIESRSEEAPGSVNTYWFQTATRAHPNGWFVRTIMPGGAGETFEFRTVTRQQAIQGFENEAAALGI